MKEPQNVFGEIYLGEKTISTDIFFILENKKGYIIRWIQENLRGYYIICCLKNPLQITDLIRKTKKDDYTISYYMSQHFGSTIEEALAYLTCHATKPHKNINDFLFILSLEETSQNGKRMRPTSHE